MSLERRRSGTERQAAQDLLSFLDAVGATEDTGTLGVRLAARRIPSAEAFQHWLERETRGETWSYATTVDNEGTRMGYALPTPSSGPPTAERVLGFPFVEVHSLLVAWWLTTAWRSRQLVTASQALSEQSQIIAAASCVRALVETAAAFWVDARKVSEAWAEMKARGGPVRDPESNRRRAALLGIINEVLLGSKFDDRVPDLQTTWGRVKRSNVLGSVEKLSKATGGTLQHDYQWLCNTVHPSLGNALFFGAMHTRHDTGTHIVTHFSGRPTEMRTPQPVRRDVDVAVATAFATSAVVLRESLDAALHVVDDLGLTTRAGSMSVFDYWRAWPARDRKSPCPCRSGRRGSSCFHEWGDDAPEIPSTFPVPST